MAACTSGTGRATYSTVRVCHCPARAKQKVLILFFFEMFGFHSHLTVLQVDGAGTYTWTNGDKYVGDWKDGNKHGQGMSCARCDKL
jgi:hypothetical protein